MLKKIYFFFKHKFFLTNSHQSLEYKMMLLLMKENYKEKQKNIFHQKLLFSEEEWQQFLRKNKKYLFHKNKFEDKSIDWLTDIILNYNKDKNNNRFEFIRNNTEEGLAYEFKMLAEGYKYQYFGHKRWEYVQHKQISRLTVFIIILALLSFIEVDNLVKIFKVIF